MRRCMPYKRPDNRFFHVRYKYESTGKRFSISTRETDERAAWAVAALWDRDGIPSREGRTVEIVTDSRRLIDNLRTADLSSSEAKQIVEVLKDRGLLILGNKIFRSFCRPLPRSPAIARSSRPNSRNTRIGSVLVSPSRKYTQFRKAFPYAAGFLKTVLSTQMKEKAF
jgi:hypothetical protein